MTLHLSPGLGSFFENSCSTPSLGTRKSRRKPIRLLSEGEANESVDFAFLLRLYLRMFTVVQAARTPLPRLFLAVFFFLVYVMASKFVSKLTFSPEDIAAADQLEPALESLLRSLKVQ